MESDEDRAIDSPATERTIALPARPPWSPTAIALATLLLSPLPGAILHALNYGRLGLPHRTKLVLFTNLFAATIFLPLAARTGTYITLLPVSMFFASHFFKTQEDRYRRHRSEGGKKARFLLPVLVSLIGSIALGYGFQVLEDLRHETDFVHAFEQLSSGKNLEQAEASFLSYQAVRPDVDASYWNLAILYDHRGEPEKAKAQLRAYLKIDPRAKEFLEYLAQLESGVAAE